MIFSCGVFIISKVPFANSNNRIVFRGKEKFSNAILMVISSGAISVILPDFVVPSIKNTLSWLFNEKATKIKILIIRYFKLFKDSKK